MPSAEDRAIYCKWRNLVTRKLVRVDFHGENEASFYDAQTLSLIFDDGTRVELSDSSCYFQQETEPEIIGSLSALESLPRAGWWAWLRKRLGL